MTIDRREALLVRLHDILDGVAAGYATAGRPNARAFRNRINVPEKFRPLFILLDGDEIPQQRAPTDRAPPVGANIVVLNPELFVVDVEATADDDKVGPRLNELRSAVVKAVLSDTQLRDLCGTNGAVVYEGCATGLSLGRSLEGEASLQFALTYVLRATDL